MTTPPPDIASIAGKLTKAQRDAILSLPEPRPFVTEREATMLTSWVKASDISVSGNTLSSLNGFGGVDPVTHEIGPILTTYDDDKEGRFWSLTSDGLTVRAHLLSKEGG